MSSQLPPINNPYQTSAPRMTPEPYAPPDRNKGIKTVSVLFIVFGILGLLTLPGLIIGTVIQLVMPQFLGGHVMPVYLAGQNEAVSGETTASAASDLPQVESDANDPASISDSSDSSEDKDFKSDLESRMKEIQKFNPVGFALGLINVILSGCLLWSGVQLLKLRLSGALLGRKVCVATSFFEIARMLFGAWTAIQVTQAFHGMPPANAQTPFPMEIVMIGSMILGIAVSIVYGTAKIVMYILCYRYLGREQVQAQLS